MFGVYVHIPFCLQRCRYCDFATYSADQIAVNSAYVDSVILEIQKQRHLFAHDQLDTIYFGGGTPSLLPPSELQRILQGLRESGFSWDASTEVTLEINPATVSESSVGELAQMGFNRMSVGAQTFNDRHLAACGRKHSAQDTMRTLQAIKTWGIPVNLDFLFALPHQTMEELREDLEIFIRLNPDHISPYCLTVPEKHPMNQNRPTEGRQTEMFKTLWQGLEKAGYRRYEISNFCKPDKPSRHNNLYWQDEEYWGVGLSAHSYKKTEGRWGHRFWNPSDYKAYQNQILQRPEGESLVSKVFPSSQYEALESHQSLTDFCHTALRTFDGLNVNSLRQKYPEPLCREVERRCSKLVAEGWARPTSAGWTLTDQGALLSNQVFAQLLFGPQDIDFPGLAPIINT